MHTETYITSSCLISHNVIYKNGKAIFTKTEDLPVFLISAYQHLQVNYPKFYKMDNLCKMGLLAAEVLLKDHPTEYLPGKKGIVLSNSSASLDTDIRYYKTTNDIASPALFVYTLPNIVIGEISIRFHFKGENAFFINEKFEPAFMEQYVSNLLNNNILQACICGWIELLEDEYKTVLFLVEKTVKTGIPFSKENLNKIYLTDNG